MLIAFGQAKIGRDVEVRHLQDGTPVANVSLAFTYGRKGQDGKWPTQWAEGVLWNKQAESLSPYLTKGTTVTVSLEDLHIETFTARDNTTGTKLVGRVTSIALGPRPADAQGQAPAPAPRAPAPAPRPATQAPAPTGFSDMDDDVPF